MVLQLPFVRQPAVVTEFENRISLLNSTKGLQSCIGMKLEVNPSKLKTLPVTDLILPAAVLSPLDSTSKVVGIMREHN